MSDGKPAIFLDRDGTLIVETGYLHEPEKVELIPGAGEAVLKRVTAVGMPMLAADPARASNPPWLVQHLLGDVFEERGVRLVIT